MTTAFGITEPFPFSYNKELEDRPFIFNVCPFHRLIQHFLPLGANTIQTQGAQGCGCDSAKPKGPQGRTRSAWLRTIPWISDSQREKEAEE